MINRALLVCLLYMVIPFNSLAQEQTPTNASEKEASPWFVDRFRLTGGFFVPISNTNVQVGLVGNVAGTNVDFERDLGFDNSQLTFLSNLQWRVSRRSRLNFYYYNIPRQSNHTIDKEIVFKDQVFAVNAKVHSFFNTAIYQVSYGYAILSKPKYEVGVLVGAHVVGADVGLSSEGSNGNLEGSHDFGFTAPLPDLGLWGGVVFSPRFATNIDVDYLSLSVNNISGSIFAYNLLFIYRLMHQLDVSAGFSGLNFNVGVNKDNVDGHFKWAYNGPALGLTYSFGRKSWR
jgi:hypothetical protein